MRWLFQSLYNRGRLMCCSSCACLPQQSADSPPPGEGFPNDGCFDWNIVKGRPALEVAERREVDSIHALPVPPPHFVSAMRAQGGHVSQHGPCVSGAAPEDGGQLEPADRTPIGSSRKRSILWGFGARSRKPVRFFNFCFCSMPPKCGQDSCFEKWVSWTKVLQLTFFSPSAHLMTDLGSTKTA